jgi:uncharacterized protein DUF3558
LSRRPFRAALAIASLSLTVPVLTGCGLLGAASNDTAAGANPAPTAATTTAAPTPTAASGLGDSVKETGDIPDPCSLLSNAEVTGLTGREITQLDRDDAEPGETTRFCQWQQDGGQLAVFLARSSPEDFQIKIADAVPVDGVGEDAFTLANHLYVLYGTVSIDVYSHGDSEAENLAKSKKIVDVLIPKI